MAKYFSKETPLPIFLPFPRFLLSLSLSNTAKLVYMLLLDRAKLSCKSKDWSDNQGRIYINYTIESLAKVLSGKGINLYAWLICTTVLQHPQQEK